jgi:hypothetical protein
MIVRDSDRNRGRIAHDIRLVELRALRVAICLKDLTGILTTLDRCWKKSAPGPQDGRAHLITELGGFYLF